MALLMLSAFPLSSPASAHPSYGIYHMDTLVEIEGIVVSFEYAIPHSWLQLSVAGEDGGTVQWALEMEGIPTLVQQGIRRDYVGPGDRITVRINPMRGNRPAGLWRGSIDASGQAFGSADGLVPPTDG